MADLPTPGTVPARGITVRVRRFRGKTLIASNGTALEMDDVGAFIFDRVDGSTSIGDIAHALAREYEVSEAVASEDCIEFVASLITAGIFTVQMP